MATQITGDNVTVPGQVSVGTAPTAATHVMRLSDVAGSVVSADPVAAPTDGVYLKVNRVNGSLWYWDTVALVWVALIQ